MTLPGGPSGGGVDRLLRELRRAVGWRRRLLAAGLLAGSMAFALEAAGPGPAPGREVLTAAHDLPTGTVLGTDDLRVVRRPETALPDGALTTPSQVRGGTVAGPVRRGEVLTDVRLAGAAALRGLAAGTVAAPVRLADAESVALLRPGDVVDVLAAGADAGVQARLVAAAVRVLTVPRTARGVLAVGAADGALVLVATTPQTAARLAAAAVTERLSVVVRGP